MKNEANNDSTAQEEVVNNDNKEKALEANENFYDVNKNDYDYNKSKRPSKRNSNVNNLEDAKKKVSLKDKVVLTTGVFLY